MTPENVIDLMKSSKSAAEWDANCDKVKAAHGGDYPSFWFLAIILSGLWTEVSATWTAR